MEAREEELFTKGFNDGYAIEDDKPSFMSRIVKGITTANDNLYVEGLLEGRKQRQNELERERIRQSIDQDKGRDKTNDRNLSR